MDYLSWLAILAVVLAAAGAWGLWEQAALGRRVRRFLAARQRRRPLDPLGSFLNGWLLLRWLGRELDRACWDISPRVFLAALLAAGAAAWILLYRLLPIGPWSALTLAALLVHIGTLKALRHRQAQLVRVFDEQLAEAARLLADALRAGRGTFQAIGEVASGARSSLMRQAFGHLHRDLELNASLEEALAALCRRIPSRELRWLQTTLLTLHRVGGDGAGMMERMSARLAERAQLRQEVLAASQKSRSAAWMVTGMGFGFVLALGVIFPGIFTVFLTPWGAALLGAYCLVQYGIWKLTAAVTRFEA